jgi:hypothetical protein
MPWYRVECTGECREVYEVEADDRDGVYELWLNGYFSRAIVTECSTDINHIEELTT